MVFLFISSIILLVVLLLLPDIWITLKNHHRCYPYLSSMPACDDVLVLGTAKYLSNGQRNAYYQYRIQAAIALWYAGKTKRFVVSGNGAEDVSETATMQADLMAAGIPAEVIWQDSAGLRTLDSVLRYADTFDVLRGQQRLCIVSQPFHNQRALFLARWQGINAIAYDAQSVSWCGGWRVQLRERAARIRCIWDVVQGTQAQNSILTLPLYQSPSQTPENNPSFKVV